MRAYSLILQAKEILHILLPQVYECLTLVVDFLIHLIAKPNLLWDLIKELFYWQKLAAVVGNPANEV